MSQSVLDDLSRFTDNPTGPFFRIRSTTSSARRFRKRSPSRLAYRNDQRLVLFFGFIRKYKGLDYLLEAMEAELARLQVHLLVAGEFYEPEAPISTS